MALKHEIIKTKGDNKNYSLDDNDNIVIKVGEKKTRDVEVTDPETNQTTIQQEEYYDNQDTYRIPQAIAKKMGKTMLLNYIKGVTAYNEAAREVREEEQAKPKPTADSAVDTALSGDIPL